MGASSKSSAVIPSSIPTRVTPPRRFSRKKQPDKSVREKVVEQERLARSGASAENAEAEQMAEREVVVEAEQEAKASMEPSGRGLRDKFGNQLDHSGVRAQV